MAAKAPKPWQRMYQSEPVHAERFYSIHGPRATIWRNDRYTAIVEPDGHGDWVCLTIRRNDRQAIHDWRHFQQIKNDVMGPEREAVELYPAQSRLLDAANQYHLWVAPRDEKIPVGYATGVAVNFDVQAAKDFGARQRALQPGVFEDAKPYSQPPQSAASA